MEHIVQALTRLIGSAMAVGGSLCWSKTTTTIAVPKYMTQFFKRWRTVEKGLVKTDCSPFEKRSKIR